MSSTTPGDQPDRLRTDAARNRDRILEAARALFAERGVQVPMAEIAHRAGVGVATLYRRFPTRDELIAGAFAAKMTAYADAVAQALADPDPWRGLTGYLHQICQMQADDHGFTNVLTATFPQAKQLEAERARAYHGLVELIDRAKATGALRADFTPEDVVLLLMANAGVVNATSHTAPEAWHRFTALMISSYRAATAEPAPAAPTPTAMYRALIRLRNQP